VVPDLSIAPRRHVRPMKKRWRICGGPQALQACNVLTGESRGEPDAFALALAVGRQWQLLDHRRHDYNRKQEAGGNADQVI
jgi:hypothetical protein